MEILVTNRDLSGKWNFLGKHQNFNQKSKFGSQIQIYLQNGNFYENIDILINYPYFGQKFQEM